MAVYLHHPLPNQELASPNGWLLYTLPTLCTAWKKPPLVLGQTKPADLKVYYKLESYTFQSYFF